MPTLQTVPQPSSTQLANIASHRHPDSISIVMPTCEAGQRVSQNAIQFKNLLREAVDQLVARGDESEGQVQQRLTGLFELQRDHAFWQHQQAGLAVYFSEGNLLTIGLHSSPDKLVQISDHYFITPVAIDAAQHRRFNVLTLSWEEAELWEADRRQLGMVENDQFPIRIRDVVLPPDAEKQLQFRSQGGGRNGGNGEAMFHGQGEGEDTLRADRLRFLSEVGRRLVHVLGQKQDSLIVVATGEVTGHFMSATDLEPVHNITSSPAQLGESQLKRLVLEWINDEGQGSDEDRTAVKERLGTAMARGQGSEDIDEIVQAASEGRVAQLFVDPHQRIWNDEQKQATEDGPRELLNWAVLHTLQTGGEVFSVAAADRKCPVAAIFRY